MITGHTHDSLLNDLALTYRRWLDRPPHGKFDAASLDNWDPDWIRTTLPLLTSIRDRYYKGKVYGLRKLPADGPYLLVGSHGGGPMNVFADNMVLFTSFYHLNHVRRPLYVAAHHIVFHLGPIGNYLAKYGAIDGTHQTALDVLRAGNGYLVYPGGEEDMARTFRDRNKVDFHGHTGFARVAVETGVPVFPLAEVGGHEVEIVLSPGYTLAKVLQLRRLVGLKTFPVSLTLPWGLTIGYLPYFPLPANILMRVGDPMYFRPSKKEKSDPHYYGHIRDTVQKEVQRLTDELVEFRRKKREEFPDRADTVLGPKS